MTPIEKEKLFEAKHEASTKVAEVYAQECYGYPACKNQARLEEALRQEEEAEKPLDENWLWNEYDEWLYEKHGTNSMVVPPVKILSKGGTTIMRNVLERLRVAAERLRKEYPAGTRVELEQMDDPQAPPTGTRGTVTGVDDLASIMVDWDNGSQLSVVYREDRVRKLEGDARK